MTDKQTQKAGDNSQLVQANTVILGIDEKRVREIVEEKLIIALKDFTVEANIIANERSKKFNNSLIKRMVQESALTAFSDPSFQILLIEAQKRAASTEREQDYDLLSELMLHRFQKGSNRIVRAGISRAVEIVDQISDEALLGITVFHSVTYFIPISGDMTEGLKTLDGLFSKVIYGNLPNKTNWLDHLDILDAIRISSFGGMKLLEDFWFERFDGYLKNGIEENSEKHNEAKELLKNAGLSENCLKKNIFNDKYVRLELLDKNRISELSMTNNLGQNRKLTNDEKSALENVYDLYDGSKIPKEDFIKEIEKYPNLKKLREWWNKLDKQSIKITSVGRVLAHSNAQRIDRSLPPLD
jgi:hypothetical protein